MKNNLKFVQSILLAAIVVCVFVPTITVAAELNPALKTWLKDTFFHHWVGKSVLSTIIFMGFSILLFFWPRKVDAQGIGRLILLLCLLAGVAVVVIFGFFLWEFFLA